MIRGASWSSVDVPPLVDMGPTRSRVVCRLLVVRAVVNAMNQRALIVTGEENVWWVRLDGVEVVSFFGPHAEQWAYREREELEQLLEAQLDAERDEQHHDSSRTLPSRARAAQKRKRSRSR